MLYRSLAPVSSYEIGIRRAHQRLAKCCLDHVPMDTKHQAFAISIIKRQSFWTTEENRMGDEEDPKQKSEAAYLLHRDLSGGFRSLFISPCTAPLASGKTTHQKIRRGHLEEYQEALEAHRLLKLIATRN